MPAGKPATPLCDQFGFDAQWRDAQLRLIGLDEYPRDLVNKLNADVLSREVVEGVIEGFFKQLLQDPQAAELLASFDLGHLKQRQMEHFKSFGVNYMDAGYFESRSVVGVAHARVGVPLSLYLSAFGVLQTLILEAIARQFPDSRESLNLDRLVLKLTTLDIVLATEVYHRAQIRDLNRSVRHPERERKSLRSQLDEDTLTGVSSRTSLLRELTASMARSTKTGQPLCLIMVDLDHFKAINDTHGHVTGDKVLTEVAARIRAALREFDMVGRFGGEEFVILLENTSHHTARLIAERVRSRIGPEPVSVGGKSLRVTVSQGLSVRQDGDDNQSLLSRADAAMYKAKQNGRDCVAEA